MIKKYSMRPMSTLTIMMLMLPMLAIIVALAIDGHLNGGVEKMTDEHWVEILLTLLVVVAVSMLTLYFFQSVRYEVSDHGIAIFFGPFRQGITWKSVRDIQLYSLPFQSKPYGVSVFYRVAGIPQRKVLMPENMHELLADLLSRWAHHKGGGISG